MSQLTFRKNSRIRLKLLKLNPESLSLPWKSLLRLNKGQLTNVIKTYIAFKLSDLARKSVTEKYNSGIGCHSNKIFFRSQSSPNHWVISKCSLYFIRKGYQQIFQWVEFFYWIKFHMVRDMLRWYVSRVLQKTHSWEFLDLVFSLGQAELQCDIAS